MTDPTDFLPLFGETLARIRARMDADAIGSLDPSDPGFPDTREGSFYWDMTQVTALEIGRLWDAFTEAVAAAFPSVAWGEYLDEHGLTFNLVRNPAIAATGTVLFTSSPGGIAVAANTQISSPPADPTLDAVTFQTTSGGTTSAQLGIPTSVVVTPSLTGGSLTAATYIYHVTAYSLFGETLGSADQAGVIASGTTGKNTLGWTAVAGAVGYRVYRTLTANTLGNRIADVTSPGFVDNGSVTPTAQEPTQNKSAGVRLAAICTTPGAAGNLPAEALSSLDTPIDSITAVANEQATVGGADVEEDEAFRVRLLAQYQGQGGGCVADYVRWSLGFGAERVHVEPIWSGPGTVLVVAMQTDGSSAASTIVSGLQEFLDPVPGLGRGQAPIGATVTVATTTPILVGISATVVHASGYSLDGSSGTIATRTAIMAGLRSYLLGLEPGGTIVYQGVLASFFVPGVQSVSGLLVDGGTSDIPLTLSPAQSAQLGTTDLS